MTVITNVGDLANEFDFQGIKRRQRVAVNLENCSTATTTVGDPVALSVALAPTRPHRNAVLPLNPPNCNLRRQPSSRCLRSGYRTPEECYVP